MSFVQHLMCNPSMHPSNSQRFSNFQFRRDFDARHAPAGNNFVAFSLISSWPWPWSIDQARLACIETRG